MSEAKTYTATIDKMRGEFLDANPDFHAHVISQIVRNLSDKVTDVIADGNEYIVRMKKIIGVDDPITNTVSIKGVVEMIPLVRCGKCRWGHLCVFGQHLGLDGFCSKGERKEQEDG